MDAGAPAQPITDEWVREHFDHLSPDFAQNLHPTLARARSLCPVAHSDQHDGFWVATRYQDVLNIAQDWQTYSSELGITVPHNPIESGVRIMPITVDPPLQRMVKRIINAHFTPAKVAPWEKPTRELVTRMIDEFIERGECDFMADFARPFPGLAFFDLVLHAPSDDLQEVNDWATRVSDPDDPGAHDCVMKLAGWIGQLVQQRHAEGPKGDVVDAVMAAHIDGRPMEPGEIIGTIQLLVLGGLETTAGVLGQAMQRFCAQPEILERLHDHPELVPAAVEELLRMDNSLICMGRTLRHDADLDGHHLKAGERILIYWASANRDEDEFDHPDEFDFDRTTNRHLAFGAGPHRCVGSNLARMNLRIALSEIAARMQDVRLKPDVHIGYHSTFNRAPLTVPITFRPGPRSS